MYEKWDEMKNIFICKYNVNNNYCEKNDAYTTLTKFFGA